MDLTVVIPTYNQAELLRECLQSLTEQSLSHDRYEVVVVDDGSTDGTQAALAQFGPPVRTIRFPANRGRSAARNAGIRDARAPLIVLVDSDILVRRDFLDLHLETHRREGSGIVSRGPVIDVSDVERAVNEPIPRVALSPAYLTTANAAVEKAALLRAGLFDEAFPAYGWEDFEFGFRLRRIGIRRVFCRQAVAFHVEPRDRQEDVPELIKKEAARARSAVHFFRKHPTFETRLLIQATGFHRAVYWLQAGGGLLTPNNIATIIGRLRQRGYHALARLGLRGVLNRYYLQTLNSELRRDAPPRR